MKEDTTTTTTPDCRDCAFCCNDPDGLFCGHETSMTTAAPFGWGIENARSELGDRPCGPEGKLFEIAGDDTLRARGRLNARG